MTTMKLSTSLNSSSHPSLLLELDGGDPLAAEEDALAPPAARVARHVEGGLVGAALHLDHLVTHVVVAVLVHVRLVAAVEGGGGGRRCRRLRHGGVGGVGDGGRDDVAPPRDEDGRRRPRESWAGSESERGLLIAGLSSDEVGPFRNRKFSLSLLSWVGCFFLARLFPAAATRQRDSRRLNSSRPVRRLIWIKRESRVFNSNCQG